MFINAAGKQGTRLYRDFHTFLKSNIICGSTSVCCFLCISVLYFEQHIPRLITGKDKCVADLDIIKCLIK